MSDKTVSRVNAHTTRKVVNLKTYLESDLAEIKAKFALMDVQLQNLLDAASRKLNELVDQVDILYRDSRAS